MAAAVAELVSEQRLIQLLYGEIAIEEGQRRIFWLRKAGMPSLSIPKGRAYLLADVLNWLKTEGYKWPGPKRVSSE